MRGHSLRLEAAFWAAVLLLVAAFVALALTASREYELAIDEKVTFAVQGLYTSAWADPLFDAANRLSNVGPLLAAALSLFTLLLIRRRFVEAGIVAAAMLPAMLLRWTDASIERPADIFNAMRGTFDGLQYPRIYPGPDGFPSGRVFGATVVYGLILWLIPAIVPSRAVVVTVRCACAAIITACFFAPMYAGYHWFTDCLGGAILAALVLLVAWRALHALRPERELVRLQDFIQMQRPSPAPSSVSRSRP